MSVYLGTTPVASGMPSYSDIIDTLFPVGSCFIGTTATCPLAAVKGTWTLRSTGIVTSVNSNVPCKGSGIALGLTSGTTESPVNLGASSSASSTHNALFMQTDGYGKALGGTNSATGYYGSSKYVVGVTTDATKSGIVGTVTSSALTVNIWERTA